MTATIEEIRAILKQLAQSQARSGLRDDSRSLSAKTTGFALSECREAGVGPERLSQRRANLCKVRSVCTGSC